MLGEYDSPVLSFGDTPVRDHAAGIELNLDLVPGTGDKVLKRDLRSDGDRPFFIGGNSRARSGPEGSVALRGDWPLRCGGKQPVSIASRLLAFDRRSKQNTRNFSNGS